VRDFGDKRSTTWNQDATAADVSLAPGKRTLVEMLPQPASAPEMPTTSAPVQRRAESIAPEPATTSKPRPTIHDLFGRVQRKAASAEPDAAAVHRSAQRGIATAASPLPHAAMIQQLFGRHDISGVKAHAGAEATSSATAMGAKAYATGDHVVLGEGADLHTVAHEAAHVVQQRGGVQLKGGLGNVGDAYERQADEVADAVVRGESAEALLGEPANSSQPGRLVQRKLDNAIVYAAHAEINLKLPYSEAGVLKALRAIHDTNRFKYDGLLAALKNGLTAIEIQRIDKALEDTSSDEEMDTSSDEERENTSGEGEPTGFDHEQQERLVLQVSSLLKATTAQLAKAIEKLQPSHKEDDAALRERLTAIAEYLNDEATQVGEGRISWTPDELGPGGNELATTSKSNNLITLRKPFFALSAAEQVDTIIHESAHAVLRADDVAYYWQRIYHFLSPEQHTRNADSHAVAARILSGGDDKTMGRRFTVAEGIVGIDTVAVEKDIALVESHCLWGITAMRDCYSTLTAASAAITLLPSVAKFQEMMARSSTNRSLDGSFALMFKTAYERASSALRRPIVVKEARSGTVDRAWSDNDGAYHLVLRTDAGNRLQWLCATLFRDIGGLNVGQALLGAKALLAMHEVA